MSLRSGRAVADALDREKYEIFWLDPKFHLTRITENRDNLDIAFILLHGRYGEDGCMQGLMEIIGIPYVGSGVLSSAMALNKKVAKQMYRLAGLEVARDVVITRESSWDPARIMDLLGQKVIVKPVSEGSSLGISVCSDEAELREGIRKALSIDKEVLVEEFLEGTELTCCIMGGKALSALPIIEIVPEEKYQFFDYEAKYTAGATREICPARIDQEVKVRVEEYAKTAHEVLGCRCWSRTDMIFTGQGICVLETNTIPGMTETSLFPLAAKASGMSLGELADRLIQISLHELADSG